MLAATAPGRKVLSPTSPAASLLAGIPREDGLRAWGIALEFRDRSCRPEPISEKRSAIEFHQARVQVRTPRRKTKGIQ